MANQITTEIFRDLRVVPQEIGRRIIVQSGRSDDNVTLEELTQAFNQFVLNNAVGGLSEQYDESWPPSEDFNPENYENIRASLCCVAMIGQRIAGMAVVHQAETSPNTDKVIPEYFKEKVRQELIASRLINLGIGFTAPTSRHQGVLRVMGEALLDEITSRMAFRGIPLSDYEKSLGITQESIDTARSHPIIIAEISDVPSHTSVFESLINLAKQKGFGDARTPAEIVHRNAITGPRFGFSLYTNPETNTGWTLQIDQRDGTRIGNFALHSRTYIHDLVLPGNLTDIVASFKAVITNQTLNRHEVILDHTISNGLGELLTAFNINGNVNTTRLLRTVLYHH